MYRTEFGALLRLAAPLVIAHLAQNTMSFVDTLMVGRLGNASLVGIALGSTIFHFVGIVLSGVIFGVGPIVSQATGAEDPETARRAARGGIWVGSILFVPAFVFYWNAYPIMILMGQSAETAADSSAYLRAISWGLLPLLWTMALRGFLEGKGNTRPLILVSFVGVILNVIFNYILMFGMFGFQALGLVGTGYASSLVYTGIFITIAVYIAIKYRDDHVFKNVLVPDFKMLKELARVGGPIGMTLGFEASMFSAAAIAMGTIGKIELAAHQIALQSASISFMVPLGLAIATSVRVGQAIGRRAPQEAAIAGRVGMLTCMVVMCLSGVAFFLAPRWIIGCYIDLNAEENVEVIRFATGFLAIAALFQIVDGLQVAASGALRGLKDTAAAMVFTGISYWGIGMTSGYILSFVWGFGGNGLWMGMTLGLAAAAICLSLRFESQIRRLARETESELQAVATSQVLENNAPALTDSESPV